MTNAHGSYDSPPADNSIWQKLAGISAGNTQPFGSLETAADYVVDRYLATAQAEADASRRLARAQSDLRSIADCVATITDPADAVAAVRRVIARAAEDDRE
jgi:hypothetical protein